MQKMWHLPLIYRGKFGKLILLENVFLCHLADTFSQNPHTKGDDWLC